MQKRLVMFPVATALLFGLSGCPPAASRRDRGTAAGKGVRTAAPAQQPIDLNARWRSH